MTDNGWDKWQKHVLLELERLNKCVSDMTYQVNMMREDLTILKVKAGLWGIIGGAITAVSVWIIKLWK